MSRNVDRALREAFAGAVEQHGRAVWRLLARAGVPVSARADLMQEIWIRLWKHFPELHEREVLWPWFRCVTYNLAVDYFKSAQRRERPCAAPGAELEMETQDMDERVAAREVWNRVLDTMPPQRRVLFVMSEVEGMTPPEISEALTLPLGTVYSRLSRARVEFVAGLAAIREGEEQRTGAVCLPLFFTDVRALIEMGSDAEPPSERTLHQIWTATLERIDNESGAPAPAPPPPAIPPHFIPFSRLPRVGLASLALLLGPLSPALLAPDANPPLLSPPAVAIPAVTAEPDRAAEPESPSPSTSVSGIHATATTAMAAPVSSTAMKTEHPRRVDDDRTKRAQLAAARAAIRRGDLAGALRLLDEHARRFRDGDYRADREALMAQIRQRQNVRAP